MSINLRSACAIITLTTLQLTNLWPGFCDLQAGENSRREAGTARQLIKDRVQIQMSDERRFESSEPTFVITHGMGGTRSGDRFHDLVEAVEIAIPNANVILLDWTEDASRSTTFLRIPDPWEVAKSIDIVAEEAAAELCEIGVDPTRTTLIGESFGNCVNAKIALHFGRRGRILAFNPPNAAGGYPMPDLRDCTDLAWSFHTLSVFDTQDAISHAGFLLETSPETTELDQHVSGICWLTKQTCSGNMSWLLMQHQTVSGGETLFDGVATLSGELQNEKHPQRQRPKHRQRPSSSHNDALAAKSL